MNFDSLTSPEDFDPNGENKIPSYDETPPLTKDEAKVAMKELFVKHYPRVDKKYCDTIPHQKKYCLVSFLPSKKAKPDSHGMYGMIKFRGTYDTIDESEVAAEYLIRNSDSKHTVHVCEMGRPFPFVGDEMVDLAQETVRVDLQQKINKEIRDKQREEKREKHLEKQQMLDRQKKLLEETKEDAPPDLFDEYTTLQVKRAQLIWSYKETEAKQEEIKAALRKTIDEIKVFDEESKEYSETYREKYYEARREAGIPDDQDGFVKFMMNDLLLPFLDN